MRKKLKIIQILCHTLVNDRTKDSYIYNNWNERLARNIISNTNKYQCEVWLAIKDLDKKIEFKKGHIHFKLFPAKTISKAFESFNPIVECFPILKDLKLEDANNTIIHFQGERGSLLHKVLEEFPEFKITIQYHGYGQPSWLDWLEKLIITPIERKNFKNVDHFFVNIKPRLEYLKKEINIPSKKISYQNVGVDFNLFKPRNKAWARKKLKLPPKAFIMLHIGNMSSEKGVDKIIKAYNILKKKYFYLYLLFVGANPTHPLYKISKKFANRLVSTISYNNLPFYYNASDVYCYYGNNKNIKYQGIGTAPTEALASNLNVVSTNLIHFPDNIVGKVGFIPKNFNDFVSKIDFLIQHPNYKFNARNIIAPYTEYKYQTTHLLKIYDKLLPKKS